MSEKVEKEVRTFTKKEIKTYLWPRAVLVIAIVAIGCLIAGWFIRSADLSRINQEASALAQQMSKTLK